jgi:hypothetical protein
VWKRLFVLVVGLVVPSDDAVAAVEALSTVLVSSLTLYSPTITVVLTIKSIAGYSDSIHAFPLSSYDPWSTPLLLVGVGFQI